MANYSTPQAAANAASGKRLVFPANTVYELVELSIPANCTVEGNNALLRCPPNSTTSTWHSDAILRVNGSGVTIDNLRFDGNAQNQGSTWSQHRHCVKVHGTFSNVTVKNCTMTNIIGDGVYVNTGTGSNIKVGPNNSFNGAYFNRNGISVVTGASVEVYQNTLTNCSRSAMPGPIDIEPNSATETLQKILVHDNTIIGGSTAGTGQLQAIMYGGFVNCPASDIQIYNNDVSGTRFTQGILAIGMSGGPFNAVRGLKIYGNNVHSMGNERKIGITLAHYIGADVYGNTISGVQSGIYNYKACLGVSSGNTFIGVTNNIGYDEPHCA